MIKHSNILYVRDIHKIGGVETFVYEMVKKYKDLDIAVVTRNIDGKQKRRLEKYCRVYIYKGEKINCKVIITNWDTSILEDVNEEAKKYCVLHTDYSNKDEFLGLPRDREDITYIGITKHSKKVFEDITGIDRTILIRNPLELEEDNKPLILVSATRLTKIKDNGRMEYLANTLDHLGINYIWFILTSDEYANNPIFKNSNVIRVQNRLDTGTFLNMANWYVQLSICEGDSYSYKEALYRGIPLVCCELPYFKEYGIKDNVNALFYKDDNSNAEDIAKRMSKPLKFTFKRIEDGYDKILHKSKSHYEKDLKEKIKIKAKIPFTDLESNIQRQKDDIWETNRPRADYLISIKYADEIKG